jgi:hypothetical protein
MLVFTLAGLRPGQAQVTSARDDLTPAPAVRKTAGLREWADSGLLRFRVDAITSCGVVTGAGNQGGSGGTPDAGTAAIGRSTSPRPPAVRLGVSVQIIAGGDEIFVSPRDVTLESGGVILQSSDPNTPLGRGCVPALRAQRVGARKSARGLVLFDVSPEFRATAATMILAYRPTRWGGAGRLEVKLPGCLEACKQPR